MGRSVDRGGIVPDIGYSYDCLDWLLAGVVITNGATLYLTNGAAIGVDFSAAPFGIKLQLGSSLVSVGSPTSLNVVVRTHAVQEKTATTSGSNNVPTFAVAYPGSSGMVAQFRFTDLPMVAGPYYHFKDGNSEGALEKLIFRDCEIRGGTIYLSPGQTYVRQFWTNNLFEAVDTTIYPYASIYTYILNNLFKEGALAFNGPNWDGASLYHNLFDKTTIESISATEFGYGYNGYITNYSRLAGLGDVILTNSPDYQTSYLGRFYLPTNSPLINAGEWTAAVAGLFSYTVTTNQVRETNSVVDIGFHRVACDPATGLPWDSDGDGLWDIWEDRNGNGAKDAGETDWNNADTDGDGVNDYIEVLQGRNPFVKGTTNDVSGLINLRVYTPLQK
jgi:hypothetical protein